MELEVKIFFISDMLMVVVWKELIGEGLRREVEVKIRGMNLGVCKSERRRRSIALNRMDDLGLSFPGLLLKEGSLVGHAGRSRAAQYLQR